ncbi:hypothetical protein BCR32DRAFT_325663 [Anaeromyces robustus]|uniref:Uncharacterized protein n=1 Tax=Anaeromyces robustus TaxID=1754192 RepID=A0A1Y1XGQ8_9FUNG|nr:hypothetical protein BCR32DRAFT_325663 [Anaeromyces robustus]|eukprot:ORX84927.1 hypothetical protein BCR32DRAFT_325663 [Anaeromyces robustus]
MIPNNTIYEAGFKNQFFTIVVVSTSLIFATWSITRLIINLSKKEENQKKLNIFYQKCIDLLNYYLDDIKYIEKGFNYFLQFRNKQVYESVAVEDGLLKTCMKKNTIYCDEYYNKVVEKHKANKEKFSKVTIYLTLSNGMTLDYMPKYPWFWDGVELFNGIHPNEKKVYNINYLSPDYIPRFDLFMSENNTTMDKPIVNKIENVKSDEEAICIGSTSSQPSDEEKKLSTLLLTKTLNTPPPSTNNEESSHDGIIIINNQNQNQDFIYNKNDSNNNNDNNNNNNNIEVSIKKEKEEVLLIPIPFEEIKEVKEIKKINIEPKENHHKTQLKQSKSMSQMKKNVNEEKKSLHSSLTKSKSLPNLKQKNNSKKQKYLKKLKHKKQPKIIYPSIPVNPNLSFTPLYEKDIKESKINSRVKHEDMETIYKKLKTEIYQKSK